MHKSPNVKVNFIKWYSFFIQILSGVPKRPEVSLVRLREIKCKIEKKSNVLDGYKNTVSVNDVFRIGDGPCKVRFMCGV